MMRDRPVLSTLAGLLVAACAAVPARAQAPVGPEFVVPGYGNQQQPSVAVRGDGRFMVAWAAPDGDGQGVFVRRFDADGAALGPEFRVNGNTAGYQLIVGRPAIDSTSDGRFMVVFLGDAPGPNVLGRRYDALGNPVGPEFQVNTYLGGITRSPSVALAEDGRFMVAWAGPFGLQNEFSDLRARFFDPTGAPATPEIIVNSSGVIGHEAYPSVAAIPGGGFLVVWTGNWPGGHSWEVIGQRFDAVGNRVGAEFRVNDFTPNSQEIASLAMGPGGEFYVVWDHWGPTDFVGVWGRRFDAAGMPMGASLRLNRTTVGDQARAQAAFEPNGNVFVTWAGWTDGSEHGIFGQLVDAQGRRVGPEMQINTHTTQYQVNPAVDADANGRMVVVWDSLFQDGSGGGVYGQRLGGLRPTALSVDSAGNGVAEPGEAAVAAPTWLNTSGSAHVLSGAVSGFGGPPGPAYTIDDGLASYGAVANGASASCGADCYTLRAAGARPAAHWDARFTETLTTDHRWEWTLHLGDSFTDVPRSNPFYGFVETLLHHRVTAGCTAADYCPSAPSTREQMAVYVLTAKEDGDYAPQDCAAPVFADMPAASPFCRWVEELARRGVVAGCGGGNYCPTAPVTREEMAVFVLRTLDPGLAPPACTAPVFADVPASSPFCPWIEELARRGIVTGCGGGNYCPSAPVTREQMGVFVSATFGLSLYGP